MEFESIDTSGAAEAVLRSQIERSGIPIRYRMRLDDYQTATNEAVTVKKEAQNWLSLWGDATPERGLYLCGVTGCGKSTLAGAIGVELVRAGRTVTWSNVAELFSLLRGSFVDRDVSEDQIVKDLTSRDVLILDDLGVGTPSAWALDVLYRVVTRVYERKRLIIVTSNLTGSALKKNLSQAGDSNIAERIVSRLVEMVISLGSFPTTDYRMPDASKNDGKHVKAVRSDENSCQVSRETK